MHASDEVLRSGLIDKVVAEVEQRLDKGEKGPLALARALYERTSAADLKARSLSELAGAALSLWQLAGKRRPGETLVRVFNPEQGDHGWQSPRTVVELVNDDMPFLVDSVTAHLGGKNLEIHLVLHPIVHVRRSTEGALQGMVAAGEEGELVESWMHIEIDRLGSAAEHEALAAELSRMFALVRAAVEDWQPMRDKLRSLLSELETNPPPLPPGEVGETIAFLAWLLDNNFTFLGFRDYDFIEAESGDQLAAVPGSGLGILRDNLRLESSKPRQLTAAMSAFARRPELIFITKTNRRSQIHRPIHMDYIGIKRFDATGRLESEARFQGLFTSASYRQPAVEIPFLRRKAEAVLARAGFKPSSHDAKTLEHIVETYPRDEVYQMSAGELFEAAIGILQLQERRRVALFVRKDGFERFVACLVFVPRDRYSTDLRHRMEQILIRAYDAELGAAYVQVGEEPLARIQIFLSTKPGAVPMPDVKVLEEALADAARTWSEVLAQSLIEERGEEKGLAAYRRYAAAFPLAYQETFAAADGGFDLDQAEAVLATGKVGVHLYRPLGAPTNEVRCKVYSTAETMSLSDVLPLFENLGFRVLAERPFEISPEGALSSVWVRDFELATGDGAEVDPAKVRGGFEDSFLRGLTGEIENDSFNRLVLAAGLGWREVVVLRAYAKYLRQAGIAASHESLAQALVRNASVARQLAALFAASFDPDLAGDRTQLVAELAAAVELSLSAVTNASDDAILRRFSNLIDCTLRTNFYQPAAGGGPKDYVSFKLDSARVADLPKPRPMFEIWVYSPRVEAIHLRGGMVARGGIRWSDRPEDFRTEVLSLMKAQMVKNAVIVPVGAKGGFVVKRPKADRQAQATEGIECYKLLVRGLLDITDNYAGKSVIQRPRVVRKDGDDPYLVVAADKGTATFSDIANALSAEYQHWLGDAFASGGSAGYDHKGMAITSRGAWESVKRHFREMGRDTQAQDFTCVGVGDMAGDVFGNGMLRSRHMKLLAAFNHLHIFVDPNPNPGRSFDERQRMFDLPRSSWKDYDPALISAGGGVFERSAKSIAVSPEMRERFELTGEAITPNELIRAILKAKADLLWLGGIGTFIKASFETHAQVNDRTNDALRIDATEVRALVVGEGANLGFTQRARIEYALEGGRINTDAIDNSGGVDCSDHEVNIKILTGEIVDSGDLTVKQRDVLLEQMTDEVADLVLRDNYLQTQALTVAASQGVAGLDRQARLIRELERAGRLDRALEGLPDDEEIAERQRMGKGFTRPELAILLAYSKITLYDQLLASDLPDDAIVAEDLALYFPTPLRERFPEEIKRHRLRREIIATHVTNSMVNRVGPTFVSRVAGATNASAAAIARAYALARDAFDLRGIWAGVEALDTKVAADAQTAMLHETKALVERATLWFLRHPSAGAADAFGVFRPAIAALASNPEELLAGAELASFKKRLRNLHEKQKVPAELARRVAALDMLGAALDIVELARARQCPVEEVARVYFAVGSRFGFDWLREEAEKLAADTPWQREARSTLVQEFFDQQVSLTGQVLASAPVGGSGKAALESWSEAREAESKRARAQITELKAAGSMDYAMLALARHQLAGLVA